MRDPLTDRPMTILHLGYEDKNQPGSGGGSVRTHEINRRLARHHDVTVVAAGWPGAEDRIEDGVRYLHAGSGRTRARAFSYFARLPHFAHRSRADLVVEDFGAPISTVGVPRFTSAPTLAVVQWMFAAEMATKYRLPFQRVENWGLRQHRRFLAVSPDLATQIAERRPSADIEVIPNGVEAGAFEVSSDPERFADPGAPLLYLGRIDIHQKGLDVLIRALAEVPERMLHIAGDGPDETRLRRLAAQVGVADRIRWLGRVQGVRKYELLAAAALVVIPSRFETFGMVAVEAAAVGVPVVGSDIACLRDVIPSSVGVRVAPGSPAVLAGAIKTQLANPQRLAAVAVTARHFARRYDWDRIADQQEALYRRIATSSAPGAQQ